MGISVGVGVMCRIGVGVAVGAGDDVGVSAVPQSGDMLEALLLVSLVCPDPSVFITYISELPSRLEWNAIRPAVDDPATATGIGVTVGVGVGGTDVAVGAA